MRWPKSRRADAATDIDSVDETPAGTVQTATVKETNETEAIAALGESDRDDQPMPSRRRIRWSRMIAYGVLPGLALLLALAAGFLKWQDNSVRDAQVTRAESVRAATDSGSGADPGASASIPARPALASSTSSRPPCVFVPTVQSGPSSAAYRPSPRGSIPMASWNGRAAAPLDRTSTAVTWCCRRGEPDAQVVEARSRVITAGPRAPADAGVSCV